jgi:hypothetical protein
MSPVFGFRRSYAKLPTLLLAFGMGTVWAQPSYVDIEIVGRGISATELAAAPGRLTVQATVPASGKVVAANPEGVSKSPRGNPVFTHSLEPAEEYQIALQHGLCTVETPTFSHKCVAGQHTAFLTVCTRPAPSKSSQSKMP